MTQPERRPVAEVLPEILVYPLPEGERPVAAFVLIKTRDADGEIGWYSRATHDYNRMEFLGALSSYVEHMRREEADGWSDDDEDAPHAHGDIDT